MIFFNFCKEKKVGLFGIKKSFANSGLFTKSNSITISLRKFLPVIWVIISLFCEPVGKLEIKLNSLGSILWEFWFWKPKTALAEYILSWEDK